MRVGVVTVEYSIEAAVVVTGTTGTEVDTAGTVVGRPLKLWFISEVGLPGAAVVVVVVVVVELGDAVEVDVKGKAITVGLGPLGQQ